MLDYKYARYLADIAMNDTVKENVMKLRLDAMVRLYARVEKYEEDRFLPELADAIFCKKAEYIMQETTKKGMEEILKLSKPHYNGNEFVPENRDHVEEEELILWSYTSLNAPLTAEGQKRYMELFHKYCEKEEKV